ncbi:hypothetical protein GYMLUDRAFT_235830 [Collybiopsis luxurians FD-317 M1]|nr:hypothetical protein GYMLUDRAFT_235830 [Collybiopsis luxurians FD-317 M1]
MSKSTENTDVQTQIQQRLAQLQLDAAALAKSDKKRRQANAQSSAALETFQTQLGQVEDDISEIRRLVTPPASPSRLRTLKSPATPAKFPAKVPLPKPAHAQPEGANTLAQTLFPSPLKTKSEPPSPSKASPATNAVWIESDSGEDLNSDSSFNSLNVAEDLPAEPASILGPGALPAAEADALSKSPRTYVVYCGHNDSSGMYYEWSGSSANFGAKEATEATDGAIYRSFGSGERELAEAAYRECRDTGVLEQLKDYVPGQQYIVLEGERPGVYKRAHVMGFGLGWHGGKIERFTGLSRDAKFHFAKLSKDGLVKTVPSWGILASKT